MRVISLARNSAVLMAAQVYSVLTMLVYVPLLTRYLGTEDFGRYNYGYAFVELFQVLSFLGLHQVLIREVARHKKRASLYFGNVLVIKVILLALAGASILGTVLLHPTARQDALIVGMCAVEMLTRAYVNVNLSLYRAYERMEYELLIVLIDRTLALLGVVVAIRLNLGLVGILLAFLGGAIVRAIASFAINWSKLVRPTFSLDFGLWRLLLSASLPIGAALEIQQVYRRQGTVLLRGIRGASQVGIYSGGFRMYSLTSIVAAAIVGALFPLFSRLKLSAREVLAEAYYSTLKLFLLLSIPLSLICTALADPLARWILGPDFSESGLVLRILSPAIVFTFINYLISSMLRSLDRQRQDALNWLIALMVNLGANWTLIPRYGFVGASMAMLLSEITFCAIGFFLASRYVAPVPGRQIILKPLACGAASGFAILALRNTSLPIALSAGFLVYVASILVLKVLSPQEQQIVRDVLLA